MISLFPFVFLFAFVTCKTFHPNQHLPVQKYQPPLRYQPLQYYPTYPTAANIPYYRPSPTKEGAVDPLNPQDISDLERQYQHWQIAPSNGQQPGVIWISAPQYSYYPPPPNGSPPNYPPPPYYPSPYPPGPYPLPTPDSNQTQPEILEVNPTQSRETVPTKPSPSETTSVDSTSTSENYTTSTETFPTFSPSSSTTEFPWTPSPTSESTENYTITYFTTEPTKVTTTTEITTNATTEYPTPTTTPYYTSPTTTPTGTENATFTTTTSAPNTTSNATNPLLKYCKKPRGQFPSDDCSKFINCWDDTAVEQTCPSGLYFNANKSYCDYPSNVNCTGSASSSEPTSSSSSPSPSSNTTSSGKCPSSYGTYRNSSNCAAFYVCVAGEPVDFYCPPGTNYNDELKVCDYPYRVNCSGIPSYPIPEESGTTIATETAPSNITSTESPTVNVTSSPNVTTSSPNATSGLPNVTTSSPNVTTSSPSFTTTSSPNFTSSSIITTTTTTTESSTTFTAPQVTEEPFPSVPPPSVDPVALYNLNLKKLPESVVNTGVRCYHTNVFRLTPDCSSVTVCQDGLTYIVNCGHDTSFDAYSQKCVSSFRARC